MSVVLQKRKALLAFAEPSPAPPGEGGPHAISAVRAFQRTTPRAHVLLEIRTVSGLAGYGECGQLSGDDLRLMRAAIMGRPSSAYEVLAPLVPENARGGLNIALLDLLGKATRAPVYRLLGGPTRNKARAVTRLSGSSDVELKQDLASLSSLGHRAFLLPIPAPLARNQGSEFIHAATLRLEAMRAAAPNADFALEAHSSLTPGDAGTLATAVQRMHPLWFDEPCPVANLSALRKIAEETVVPLGFGRNLVSPSIFQDLLRDGLIDLLRLDVAAHGMTGIRRLAAMAETYYVDVSPFNEGGAIGNAAAIHAAASIPNFFIAQLSRGGPGVVLRDGFYELPKGPGLGITIDPRELTEEIR